MAAAEGSCSFRQDAEGNGIDSEHDERPAGAEDVHNGIDCADFMKMHVMGVAAVDFAFGVCQTVKDFVRQFFGRVGHRGVVDDPGNFGKGAFRSGIFRDFHFQFCAVHSIIGKGDFFDGECVAGNGGVQSLFNLFQIGAETAEGGENHVSGGAADTVKTNVSHFTS